jgi:urease accessory protein
MLQRTHIQKFEVVRSSTPPDHHMNPQQDQSLVTAGSPTVSPLRARLAMKFGEDLGATRLIDRGHFGPLLIQKPLYPEGREVCQVVIVHPPGGVVGGDQLEIAVQVGNAAKAQITTPGAAKWYKANGHISRQNVRLEVGVQGSLEWVPQEAIFFNNAHVVLDHQVTLAKEASYIGSEILCFGRTASGESFSDGQIRSRYSIRYENKLIWHEQFRLLGGSAAMKSSLGLGGNTVCATLIAVGKVVPPTLISRIREETGVIINGVGTLGVTQMKSIVVARYLGNSSETARRVMLNAWGLLRPTMLNRPAMVPRMWNT